MYLLDTNHCHCILNNNQDISSKLNDPYLELATCVIVKGELVYMAKNSRNKSENLASLNKFIEELLIFDIDSDVSVIYGEVKANLIAKFGPKEKKRKQGYAFKKIGISDNDLWIASVAIKNNVIILTQDKDFNRIQQVAPIKVESWLN